MRTRWQELVHVAQETRRRLLREGIRSALAEGGNVTAAARLLGVDRNNLRRAMRAVGMHPEDRDA